MSLDLLLSGRSEGRLSWLNLASLAALFWAVLAGTLLVRAALDVQPVYLSTDDHMRLVSIRDLLAGQSWFDATQYRMNTPYGLPMHWSRLVDGGVALLILFFRLFFNPHRAELAAIYLWPLLWLLPCFVAVARLGRALGGEVTGGAALLLGITCVTFIGYFQPGTIDQHNVHMALTLWGLVFLLEFKKSEHAPVWLASITALNLALGLETLPYVLATCATVAWFWLSQGAAVSARVRNFALAFAGAAALLLFLATPTAERMGTACDTYSGIFGELAIFGGAGLGGLALFARATVAQRIAGIVLLGGVLLALTFATAPECLSGPYAHVDDKLNRIWLSRIEEVISPFVTMPYEPGAFFSTYVYAAVGFIATIASFFLVPKENREAVVILSVFAAIALAITSVEVRGTPFAVLFGLPGLAATITALISRYVHNDRWAVIAGIAAIFTFSNIAFDVVGRYAIEGTSHVAKRTSVRSNAGYCMSPQAVTELATLPKGRVAAMSDQGPVILAHSPHSVIAGPYHRNRGGIVDTYDLFTQKPAVGANILKVRGIDYLMTCKSSPDYGFYLKEGNKDSLLHILDKGQVPLWLKPIEPARDEKTIRIFRILKDRL